jgi:hypothetical protein
MKTSLFTIQSLLEKLARQLASSQCCILPMAQTDMASSDFHIFGNKKGKLQSDTMTDQDNLTSAITEIFNDTAQDQLIAASQN